MVINISDLDDFIDKHFAWTVRIEFSALKKMIQHVVEHANFRKHVFRWKECYGLIIGYNDEETQEVVVTNAIPVTHGSSVHVEFSERDYVFAAQVNDLLLEKEREEFFVGWYHSHPGMGFFLSHTDIINQLGFQQLNPKAIAIVFDHVSFEREQEGFRIFRLRFMEHHYGYREIPHVITPFTSETEAREAILKTYFLLVYKVRKKTIEKSEKMVRKRLNEWLK
ncbi:MAG: Mov34/MPN/PAD-1 family protein [Candidatus Helarchaeota archaeon]